MNKTKVAIIGATGYTGSELLSYLKFHEKVEVIGITSESKKGRPFSEVHPQFFGIHDDELISINDVAELNPEIVFLALPHGVSMDFVKDNYDSRFRIIDLSGDFRLSSPEVYERWYNKEHVFPEGFDEAVYGLPELYREKIKNARLIANPGCFPTCSILALAPVFKNNLAEEKGIYIDAKTGVTGAGIKAKPNTHFPMVNDNFTAYGIKTHRHTIEIQETLNDVNNSNSEILFTPHLLPVDRGILATCYLKPKKKTSKEELKKLYKEFYNNEPFIRLREDLPNLKQVRASNFVDIYVDYDERTDTIIVLSAIDNLVKGAAGQGIQNMNLALGFEEDMGLLKSPLQP